MRLFVAITPPAEVIEDLDVFLETRRDEGGGLRWSPSWQWHLTLAFCAAFPEHRLDDLDARLVQAARKRRCADAHLHGGGAFPDVARAKVLWLGLAGDGFEGAEVERLAAGARVAIAKSGGAVAGQRFRAHLTLARMGRPIDATRWVRLLDGYRGPAWTIDSIDLIASHLGESERGRPRYETLATYPLGPATDEN